MAAPRIYLAGYEVFLPNPRGIASRKREICARFGFEGLFPLDNVVEIDFSKPLEAAKIIFRANKELMRGCGGAIVNATPFLGLSMDAGSAFEAGFIDALGLPLIAYTNEPLSFAARRRAAVPYVLDRGDGIQTDPDGVMIEDLGGLRENLMIDCAAMDSGDPVVYVQEPPPGSAAERLAFLGNFEAACAAMAKRLGTSA